MPIIHKDSLSLLRNQLAARYDVLIYNLGGTALEGGSRGRFLNPDNLRITVGNESNLRIAVDDFKTILAEIKRLK